MKKIIQNTFSHSANRSSIVIILLLAGFLVSCKKFVEVSNPATQLVTNAVFDNNPSANAAQIAVYAQMAGSSSFKLPLYAGLSGDELTNYSSSPSLLQLYSNGLVSTNDITAGLWTDAYQYIYEENAVLEGLSNSTLVTPDVKKQLTGEAKFIRAFWYFYLVNLYGDVPLAITTDYRSNATLPRSTTVNVYTQIVADLKDAQGLLSSNFVGKDGIANSTERIRPTRWAASALLSRVQLFTGDFSTAVATATGIINNVASFNLVTDLDAVFLSNSPESIWQLQPVITDQNTPEGYGFILSATPSTVALNPMLLDSFEMGDNRKTHWIDSIVDGTDVYYYPFKYKVQTSGSVTEYSTVFRLAEQYLIRAEAGAQSGNNQAALADLNILRARAGLSPIATTDKTKLLSAIAHERQIELFTEWGFRWIDMKRTNTIDPIMSAAAVQKGGIWSNNKKLFPIPQSERDNDPNLAQNPGY